MTINVLERQAFFLPKNQNSLELHDSPASRKIPEYSTYRKFTSGFLESEFVRKHPRHAAIFMLLTINATKEGKLRVSSGEFLQRYPNLVGSKRSFFRQLDWLEDENYISLIKSTVGTTVIIKEFKEHQSKKRYVRIYCDDFRKLIRKTNLTTATGATSFFNNLREFYKKEIEDDVERKKSFEVRKTKTMLKDSLYLPDDNKTPRKTPHPYIYSKGYCNIGFNKTFDKTMASKKQVTQEEKKEYQNKMLIKIERDSEYLKTANLSQDDFIKTNQIKEIFEKYLGFIPSSYQREIFRKHLKIFSVKKTQIFIEIFNFSAKNDEQFNHIISTFNIFHASKFLNFIRDRYQIDAKSTHIIIDDGRSQRSISSPEKRVEA